MDSFDNIETIRKSLTKIINGENEFVAIISGEWGSGKTYFWNKFVNNLDKDIKYAYISFFGINSIEEIRQKIFFKVSRKGKTANWLKENISDTIKNIRGAFNIEENTKLTLDGGLLNLAFSLMGKGDFKNVIICFDDFERLSDKVSLKDVMGLISELKEEKECKVILILNENELENLSQINGKKLSEIFALYKEKIVDYDFNFIPSIEYCFDVLDIETSFDKKIILDVFIEKNIRNIRVMFKIIKHIKNFEFINDYGITEKAQHKFLMIVVKLFIYKEMYNISYKELKKMINEYDTYSVTKIYETETEIETTVDKDYKIYEEYIEHTILSDFNKIIFDYLYKHYIDKEALEKFLTDENTIFDLLELEEELEETEKNYNFNLKMTEKEYINKLVKILEPNKERLPSIVPIKELKRYLDFLSKSNNPKIKALKKEILEIFIIKYLDSQDNAFYRYEKPIKEIIQIYPELQEVIDTYREGYKLENSLEDFIQNLIDKQEGAMTIKENIILKNNKDKIEEEILKSGFFLNNLLKIMEMDSKRSDINNIEYLYEIINNLKNKNYYEKITYLYSLYPRV